MKTRLLFLFGILLICLTCITLPTKVVYTQFPKEQPKTHINIHVDVRMDESQKHELHSAIEEWNYVLNGNIILDIIDENFDMEIEKIKVYLNNKDWIILIVDKKDLSLSQQDKVLAFVDNIGGNVLYLIKDTIQEKQLRGLLLHEAGHLLGAQHKNHSLMNATYSFSLYNCIDKETVIQVADYNNITDKMNFCY